jgi:hypothetical protein
MYRYSCGFTTKRDSVISVICVIVSSEIHDGRARRAVVTKQKLHTFDSRTGSSSCSLTSYAKVPGQSLGSEITYFKAVVCYFPTCQRQIFGWFLNRLPAFRCTFIPVYYSYNILITGAFSHTSHVIVSLIKLYPYYTWAHSKIQNRKVAAVNVFPWLVNV